MRRARRLPSEHLDADTRFSGRQVTATRFARNLVVQELGLLSVHAFPSRRFPGTQLNLWGLRLLSLGDPILLPQHLCFLRAAKRIERVGSDAGAVLGPRVVQARSRLMGRERGLRDGQTLRGAPCLHQQARVVARISLCQWMVAAERLLVDCDGLAEQRLGLISVAGIS